MHWERSITGDATLPIPQAEEETMAEKSIAQKLMIKEGRTVLLVNQPPNYVAMLGELPSNVIVLTEPTANADIIQLFVSSRAELEAQLLNMKAMLNANGMLWVTYPKGTSKIKTDINRDSIYAYALTLGLEGVAIISVDDTWSALRLKVIA